MSDKDEEPTCYNRIPLPAVRLDADPNYRKAMKMAGLVSEKDLSEAQEWNKAQLKVNALDRERIAELEKQLAEVQEEIARMRPAKDVAKNIARSIFELGSEDERFGGKVQRIQFMGGNWPGDETGMGGLCESALTSFIEKILLGDEQSITTDKGG